MRHYIAAIAFLFAAATARASDTIILTKPVKLLSLIQSQDIFLGFHKKERTYFIQNGNFKISDSADQYYSNYILLNESPIYLNITSCTFSNPALQEDEYFWALHGKYITLNDCHFDQLSIEQQFSSLQCWNCELNNLSFAPTSNAEIEFINSQLNDKIHLTEFKNLNLTFYNCGGTSFEHVIIEESRIKQFVYHSSRKTEKQLIEFNHDTINQVYLGPDPDSVKTDTSIDSFPHVIKFYKCYINGAFSSTSREAGARVLFDNCTFGPEANLSELSIERVEFTNCRNLTNRINIGFMTDSPLTFLRIINSDIDNIDIIWTPTLKIVFIDSTDTSDEIVSSFEGLLSKYKRDSKEEIYKTVDLQYRKKCQGRIFHFIDRAWWYHGYRKELVFAWTFVFLLFFMTINYRHWSGVHDTYPIVAYRNDYFNNLRPEQNKMQAVFLYTVFVFFSLKIDFDKLKTNAGRSYIALFFLQYLSGVFCLLFIVKAVFQL